MNPVRPGRRSNPAPTDGLSESGGGLEDERRGGALAHDGEDPLGHRPLPGSALPEVGHQLLRGRAVGHHAAEHVLGPGVLAPLEQEDLGPGLGQTQRRAGAGRSRPDDDGVETALGGRGRGAVGGAGASRRPGRKRRAASRAIARLRRCIAPLLDLLHQSGQDHLEIGDVAHVGELEDGRPHIPVDGEHPVGLAHAGHVMGRAGDAQGDVQLRSDRPACLPDQPLLGQAARRRPPAGWPPPSPRAGRRVRAPRQGASRSRSHAGGHDPLGVDQVHRAGVGSERLQMADARERGCRAGSVR